MIYDYDEDYLKTHAHMAEKTLDSEYQYKGTVVNTRVDNAVLPDGQPAKRDVVEHPGGVVVLPVLPDGKILLLEQWRYPLKRPLIECPAGKLDPGEYPNMADAAQRELMEETGYKAGRLEPCHSIFTSPGFCDERLWLYIGYDLSPVDNHEEIKQADEFIDLLPVTADEAFQMVKDGKIVDAKTICLLWHYYYQLMQG